MARDMEQCLALGNRPHLSLLALPLGVPAARQLARLSGSAVSGILSFFHAVSPPHQSSQAVHEPF